MKRIVKLTESDLTRIVKRVIKEQEKTEEECKGLCYLFYEGKCVQIDDLVSYDKTKKWYNEKTLTESWFFDLIETDRDVKELYESIKYGDDSWTHTDEMIFFKELAISYCEGRMEEYIEIELSHPCYEEKPKPDEIIS